MKPIITMLLVVATITNSFSQETSTLSFKNFETDFFIYNPEQKKNVTDDHFSFAKFVISETKADLKNDVNNYKVIHYWNILTAIDKLKVDKSTLIIAFQRMVEKEGSCNYIINYKEKVSFYNSITAMYEHYYSQCRKATNLELVEN